MNKSIPKQINVNQWRNTTQVITWFKNIRSTKTQAFMNFDVEKFCPSISIDLVMQKLLQI